MGKAKAKAQTETILKLSDLAEWERNPRTITDEAMAGLGKSIESFGDVSGITWNKRLGALVAGHQRVKQLRDKANGQEVPIQMLSPDLGVMVVGGKAFSVRVVDWDESTHAAAAIAVNSRHIAGEWVDVDLAALLGEVQELSSEMFEELRFDALAEEYDFPASSELQPESKVAVEKGEELRDKWQTEIGQEWRITGKHEHIVYCGNCFDWCQNVDGVCTDPPYDFLNNDLLAAVGKFGDVAAILCTGKQAFNLARDGWHYERDFVWMHEQPRSITFNQPIYYHVNILVMAKAGHKSKWRRPRPEFGSVIRFNYDHSEFGQAKPVGLFVAMMEGFQWTSVADPFAGTLPVLVAAEQLGMRFLGCEISPEYLAIGLERCAENGLKVLLDNDLMRYNTASGESGSRRLPEHTLAVEGQTHV